MKRVKLGERTTLENLRANCAAQGYELVLEAGWGDPNRPQYKLLDGAVYTMERDEDHGALEVCMWETEQGGVMVGGVHDRNLTMVYGRGAKWKNGK